MIHLIKGGGPVNFFLLASATLAIFTCIGHFILGYRMYVKPMLQASMPDIPKKVMLTVFHYMSVFLSLSALVLFLIAIGIRWDGCANHTTLVRFIAGNYFLMGVVQIIIAYSSKITNGIVKMFQWLFFLSVALLAFAGTL